MAYVLFKLDNGMVPIGVTESSFPDILARAQEELAAQKLTQPYINLYISTYEVDTTLSFPKLKARQEFINQSIIPFDIDNVTWPEDKYQYAETLVRAAVADSPFIFEKISVICSGNGVQFFAAIKTPLVDRAQYDRYKLSYVNFCAKMQSNIEKIDKTAKFDLSVWCPARVMRMPGTLNQKEGKPTTEAFTIKSSMEPIDSPLEEIVSEYREIPQELPPHRLPPTDTPAVLSECGFLKHCFEEQEKVTEPEWLAMISIVSRLDEGSSLVHKFSDKHPNYTYQETEKKIEHAQEVGPRTCANIASMHEGCASCPHFIKESSPITIKGDLYCGTQDSGFYFLEYDSTGKFKSSKPDRNGLANHLIKTRKLRSTGDTIYQWDGDKYTPLDDMNLIGETHRTFNPLPATLSIARETIDIVRSHPRIFVDRNENLSARFLNFKNGILDKHKEVFLDKTPDFFFRYCLDFNYDADAQCPRFDKFLQDVSCGDLEIEQCMLEFGGYALSGDEPWEHKALIMHGLGANGKSTFIEVLKRLAGSENYTALGIRRIADSNNARTLQGKLFNAADETPIDAFKSYAELFKNLVAGGEIDAHKKYFDSFSFRNTAKIIFACNDMPGIPGTDNGITRRIILVPFKANFEYVADKFILEDLKKELPGIFNKMWSGYKKAKLRKCITVPNAAKIELEGVRYDSNPLTSFFFDRIEITKNDNDIIKTEDLYAAYLNYFLDNNFRSNELSKIHFARSVGRIGENRGFTGHRTGSVRGFKGIKIKSEEDF